MSHFTLSYLYQSCLCFSFYIKINKKIYIFNFFSFFFINLFYFIWVWFTLLITFYLLFILFNYFILANPSLFIIRKQSFLNLLQDGFHCLNLLTFQRTTIRLQQNLNPINFYISIKTTTVAYNHGLPFVKMFTQQKVTTKDAKVSKTPIAFITTSLKKKLL